MHFLMALPRQVLYARFHLSGCCGGMTLLNKQVKVLVSHITALPIHPKSGSDWVALLIKLVKVMVFHEVKLRKKTNMLRKQTRKALSFGCCGENWT